MLNSKFNFLFSKQITGLETNVNFLIDLASHPSFRSADVHTGFIPQHFDSLFPPLVVSESLLAQAASALVQNEANVIKKTSTIYNPFHSTNNFRLNHSTSRDIKLKFNDKIHNVQIKQSNNNFSIRIDNGNWKNVQINNINEPERFTLRSNIDGILSNFSAVISPDSIEIFNKNGKTKLEIVQPKFLTSQEESGSTGSTVISPMPGVIDKMLVRAGDKVNAGDPLAVIIAMKMEHVLKASKVGVVKSVGGQPGDSIAKGAAVVTFETDEEK